jgi:hypothetical protein
MEYETQDRRQHARGNDILTKIEDLTYAVLRRSIPTGSDVTQQEAGPVSRG